MKPKILLIEDEADLGNVVKQYLEIMDFEVEWIKNGKEALDYISANPKSFNILLIDVSLPGLDGFELADRIVEINPHIPFLFLTARNEKQDRIRGLKIGADDYITKPFDIDELVLRIRNIIKRQKQGSIQSQQTAVIEKGDVKLYKDQLKLVIKNEPETSLTQREAELLEYLFRNENRVLKREEILTQLWGKNDYFLGRSLDVFISRLRKILSKSSSITISNVYGVGFMFEVKN